MAAKKKIRLFKIASEINIGRETIVEFLQGKGFDIQNKPTASLDPDMAEAVYEKFKREKRAAEIQREKIQKHKEIRKTSQQKPSKEEENKEEAEKVAAQEVKPIEEIPEEITVEESKPIEEKTEKSPDTVPEESTEKIKEEKAPEVETPEPIEDKKEEPAKSETKKAEVVEEDSEKVEVAKKDSEKTPEEQPKAEEVKETKKPKEIETEEPKKSKDTKKQESIEEPKAEPKEEPKAEPKEEPKDISSIDKEKQEAQQKEEPQENVHDDSIHLKGLKIVGKIDIKKDKPSQGQGKPKKKDSEDGEDNINKTKAKQFKKRKRKTKDIDISAEIKETKKEEAKPSKSQDKKRRKKKKSIREQISQEDIDKAIKETLAGMEEHHSASSRTKIRQKKKQEREEKEQREAEEKEKEAQTLKLTEFVTTSDLANLMGINPNDVILKCMQLGLMVTINQRLDKDTIQLIASDYNFEVEFIDEKQIQFIEDDEDPEESLKPRPPIVTIMGHVDHGKTSLLDFIRSANVVAGEAGGITQHIGAYQVEHDKGKYITFLDTPGHEAFTAMRARGAQVTDIVVLVVAADDSVMPQTIEAISHARAAKVPIVVAINKIDKPDANPDRIKQQLSDHNILVEDWGGKYQSVELSAKKGINVDHLLEKILLEAELLELTANPDRQARGIIVEANMSKGLGSTATLIVQKGTLKIGDSFVAGVFSGKVRAMHDERGNRIQEAGPSSPVLVIGFDGLPEASDAFTVVNSESEARNISNERRQLKREQELRQVRHVTLDEISQQILIGGVKELYLVIKGDVSGSIEAISDSLLKLSTDEVRVVILHKGVGSITESDVMLAAASGAVVIGFNISPTAQARRVAENERVDIRIYDIIYDCINEIQMALEGLLSPDIEEQITATIEVRKTFKISKLGIIAGCYVKSGKISRKDKVKLLREGEVIYDGGINSLKRNKDDVKEVDQNYECGIQLQNFNDVEVGDTIEAYKLIEIKRKL